MEHLPREIQVQDKMGAPVLIGEYELTLEQPPKNRLLIPADLRNQINDAENKNFIVQLKGHSSEPDLKCRTLWLYPKAYFLRLAAQVPARLVQSPTQRNFQERNFALSEPVECDSQGRVVIPQKLIDRSGLGREVTLLAMGDHAELWPRDKWNARRERLYELESQIDNDMATMLYADTNEPKNSNGRNGLT
jgi:MraZ protein